MTAGFWTLNRVARALGGGPDGPWPVRDISTDTRAIQPGDLFVALAGERYDAHEFLDAAVCKGAAAVVVSRPEMAATLGVPVYTVSDTLRALGALANYRRRAWGKPVVAITGSNGKTTTKELVRAALASTLEVHATSGNLNNLVGVPLTLLALPDEADVAVVEMGMSVPGEIRRLREIAEPEIAVVTSVAEGHLEGVGDLDGVLREKACVFHGALVAVTPAEQPEIAAAATGRARRVVTAGLEVGEVRAESWGTGSDGLGWLVVEGVTIRQPLRGAHNLRNAMLALAVARECGVAVAEAARGMESMSAPAMRVAWETLGRITLVNDAYNANPGSVRAAIDLLDGLNPGRQRVAVLGTMRELGAHADRLHREIAEYALRSSIDVLAGIGAMADALRVTAGADDRVVTAPDVDELWNALRPRLTPDAVVLLKASRGVKLERLVPLISAWATP